VGWIAQNGTLTILGSTSGSTDVFTPTSDLAQLGFEAFDSIVPGTSSLAILAVGLVGLGFSRWLSSYSGSPLGPPGRISSGPSRRREPWVRTLTTRAPLLLHRLAIKLMTGCRSGRSWMLPDSVEGTVLSLAPAVAVVHSKWSEKRNRPLHRQGAGMWQCSKAVPRGTISRRKLINEKSRNRIDAPGRIRLTDCLR
jgi:hypothetical protein